MKKVTMTCRQSDAYKICKDFFIEHKRTPNNDELALLMNVGSEQARKYFRHFRKINLMTGTRCSNQSVKGNDTFYCGEIEIAVIEKRGGHSGEYIYLSEHPRPLKFKKTREKKPAEIPEDKKSFKGFHSKSMRIALGFNDA